MRGRSVSYCARRLSPNGTVSARRPDRVHMEDKSGEEELRAAVVGGGIGGLSAACSLLHRGVDVTVFEQTELSVRSEPACSFFRTVFDNWNECGSAKPWPELEQKSAAARNIAARMARLSVQSSRRTPQAGMVSTACIELICWTPSPPNYRPKQFGPAIVALELTKLIDFAQLQFAHGGGFEADVIIAADGIHSTLQKYVVEPALPEYSGVRAYRGLIPRDKLPGWPEAAHTVWMGEGKHFIAYPVRSGRLLNYVGFVPTKNETIECGRPPAKSRSLWVSFDGWDPRIVRLLETVESCYWWGLYDRRPLASWTSGRLVLLGDAAHAMLPHLGQGLIRRLKMASPWRFFSRGETRKRSQIFCRDMKYFDAPGQTVFKLKRGKPGFVTTPSITAWRSAIAKSQKLGSFANHL